MKFKVVVLAIAAACSAFAHNAKTAQEILAECPKGDATARYKWQLTLKVDEIKAVADYAIEVSKTNLVAGKAIAVCIRQSIFKHRGTPAPGLEIASEYDAKFADAGLVFDAVMWKNAPKSTEKFLVTYREGVLLKEFPAYVQHIRKCIENKDDAVGICEVINHIAECGTKHNSAFDYRTFDQFVSTILRNAPRRIRRKLRERGIPIVVKDEVNHVQDAVDELSSALNAPKMAGVKEWLSKWFPDYKWIDVKWMSDEELAKFKDDIFYGDVDFTDANRVVLRSHLGVDAYNEFVKKYNN